MVCTNAAPKAIAGTTKGADADLAEMFSVRVLSRDGEVFN